MPAVIVTKRGADRVRAGHLWIYRSDVTDPTDAAAGSIVVVQDHQRNFVGRAFYSDRSEIALRLLTKSDEPITREWWRRRMEEAASRRQATAQNTNAYRLFYSEADLIPSLIIDRYNDILVLQTLAQGTDAIKPLLVELLIEQFSPRTIVERNDVRVRGLEGLPLISGLLYGEAVDEVEAMQHGLRFVGRPSRDKRPDHS